MTAPSITEFLLARIAEDEVVARAAAWVPDPDEPDDDYDNPWAKDHGEFASRGGAKFTHILRNDPPRVLAECAAKRAIVDLHFECRWASVPSGCSVCRTLSSIPDTYPCRTVSHLAAVYDSHPDYRQEWAL